MKELKSGVYWVEATMLHWPDSMFTYLTGENILFSNDAFGQHFASSDIFNDEVDETEVYQEALKFKYMPDEQELEQCITFGKEFAEKMLTES